MKIPVMPCTQTDVTNLTVAFRSWVEVPKIYFLILKQAMAITAPNIVAIPYEDVQALAFSQQKLAT
jgi:hypothetical protein